MVEQIKTNIIQFNSIQLFIRVSFTLHIHNTVYTIKLYIPYEVVHACDQSLLIYKRLFDTKRYNSFTSKTLKTFYDKTK